MFDRRNFLRRSSLLSLSPLVPGFLARTVKSFRPGKDKRILVVVEMEGGNDGLNTVIPFADENYARYRNKLAIEKKSVIRLGDSLGLHPSMKAAAELFDNQQLAIIPGVGYPNPSRSHFRSRDIWHSARLDATERLGKGWLGLAGDRIRTADSTVPDAVFVGEDAIPTAIVGRRANSIAIAREQDLILASGLQNSQSTMASGDIHDFVRTTVDSSFAAAKQFAESSFSKSTGDDGYPAFSLARKLRLISRMIRLNQGTQIYYVSQSGYDTHFAQAPVHANLLNEFSQSLKAFLNDLQQSGLGDRVVVLAYSEFGRRVIENSSYGTDHGTSGPVFVAGPSVNAGILGEYPSLGDLVDDDLKTLVDFRSIYASLLTDWLAIDASEPLAGKFKPLDVIQS